MGTVGSFPG